MPRHALLLLFSFLTVAPAAAETLAERCAAMARAGNVQACERAIAADPADDASRRHLGEAFLALGDGGMSILTYRDLLTRHPGDWSLHYDLAVAITATMRYSEAVEPAMTALKLHP